MLEDRNEMKKLMILTAVLILLIGLGSEMKTAFAGQDIGSMVKNWFLNENAQMVTEVEQAIAAETDALLEQLRLAIEEEKNKAQLELQQFKQEEIARRIDSLQNYAADLIGTIGIDNSAEMATISAHLDEIFAQAISQMGGALVPSLPPADSSSETPIQEGGTTDSDSDGKDSEIEGDELDTGEDEESAVDIEQGSESGELDSNENPTDSVESEETKIEEGNEEELDFEQLHTYAFRNKVP